MAKVKHIWGWILSSIMTLLGFSSCDLSGSMVMYGVPSADYLVGGKVTDKTGKPINGIKVDVVVEAEGCKLGEQTVNTDQTGAYEVKLEVFPSSTASLNVYFEDTDGEANGGLFKSDSLKNVSTKLDKKNSDSWFVGTYKANADITLKNQD